ncbi:MAG: DNA mismatch repair endonuclease MutL [Acidobacteriota bacterium]
MNRIRLLPEHVANQIAAGEVVERPASVVKELVENALDAQSTRITVEVQAGGRSLIRVTDDGLGMSRDDALLCLERHATSKIQRAEDLHAVTTMGFRGEALPSIASVSRLSLTTRERETENPAATQIIIHGGKIVEVKEAGAPHGTSIEVRSLFFNLPARRKFLRSEETEYAHINHYLTLAALAHPHLAFTFIKDGRAVWQLAAVNAATSAEARVAALRERMRALFGDEQKLLAVDFSADLPAPADSADDLPAEGAPAVTHHVLRFTLWGLIGAPGVSRSSRENQHVFVNRRPVENRGLSFALVEGYHTALMKGRFPVCCLFLEIDPSLVDVNIHPSKREVKFHNERVVRELAARAVRETLMQFHGGTNVIPLIPPVTPPLHLSVSPPPAPVTKEFPQFTPLTGTPLDAKGVESKTVISGSVISKPAVSAGNTPAPAPAPTDSLNTDSLITPPLPRSPAPPLPADPTPLLRVPLRLVGVVGRLYVVLESDRGLVLMDQHAAHERVLFEQMLARLQTGDVPQQRLLLPETVELSVKDAHFLRENLASLTRLGVGLSEFGERTFLLDGLPPMVKAPDSRRFVLELIDELKSAGAQVNAQRLGEHTIAKTVCRHAVKANDPLNGPELENLVNDLRACAMPYTCPHGRPTLIEMNYRELEKKFGRQQ